MYKAILNRVYKNTLLEAKKLREQYETTPENKIISRTLLQGQIMAYNDFLIILKAESENVELVGEEDQKNKAED